MRFIPNHQLVLSFIACGMTAIFGATPAPAAPVVTGADAGFYQSTIRPFLSAHCFDCHGDSEQKGGLRLDTLAPDFARPASQQTWIDIFDKLSTGEMPPKKKQRPPAAQLQQVIAFVKNGVGAAELAHRNADGRVKLRRLNRSEYERTLHDLLNINVDLKDLLPEDNSSMGFDNVADALNVSSVLMERYLEAADAALDAAIPTGERPQSKHLEVAYGFSSRGNKKDYRLKTGMTVLPDETFVLFSSSDTSPITCDNMKVPLEGDYHIKLSGYAYQSTEPITISVLAGSFSSASSQRRVIGYYDLPPDPKNPLVIEFTEHLPKNGTIKVLTYHLGQKPLNTDELVAAYKGPGAALSHVQRDGPLNESWPPAGYARLFGKLDVSKATAADATKIITSFAARAFRRPLTAGEAMPYVDLVKSRLSAGESFITAVRVALKAILCSPDFLFLKEHPGKLDDYAVASRMAYFFWGTMPDDELFRLAESHTLTRPDVLRKQTERMLNDPRGRNFIVDFTGQWLNLRQIDFTTPERRLYPKFDTLLQWSMVQESEQFFTELLKNDLSITNIIDSNFSMINGPLAKLYGIEGVNGTEIRKVALPTDIHRGGVLGQAAVLKVTANGSTTSPVIRGSWVMRNIVGRPPKPPPPNVPAIEPDIRGATSIRDILAKHRTQPTCAACHANIDPPGFALESFDVIGGWRENYQCFGGGLANGYLNGKSKFKPYPKLDASGVLPDGRPFADFDEFKKLLMADKEQVARCLTEKLLIYSTGAGLDFVDRPAIETILQHAREHNYGLRTLIHEVVESPVFLQK